MFQLRAKGYLRAPSVASSWLSATLLSICAVLCNVLAVAATPGSVTYTYDEAGRLKSTTYQNGASSSYKLDAAGNRTQTATGGPDAVAPSVPAGLSGTAASSTQVNLSWSASTDTGGSGLAGYRIYRGGTQIGTSATNSYSDTTTSGTTAYSYTVAAYDNAGNASAQSTAASVTTPNTTDTTPPSVPGVPSFTNITPNSATVSWTAATDNVGVSSYEYQKNGGAWTSAGNVLTINLTGLTATTGYTIGIHAKDLAGNTGTASSASFTTTQYYTDAPVVTGGTNSTNRSEGFDLATSLGSISPTTTANGFTYQTMWDRYASQQAGGQWVSAKFAVSGFAADPGASWLSSVQMGTDAPHAGATAAYSYGGGLASWTWTTAPLNAGPQCIIIHK